MGAEENSPSTSNGAPRIVGDCTEYHTTHTIPMFELDRKLDSSQSALSNMADCENVLIRKAAAGRLCKVDRYHSIMFSHLAAMALAVD